MQSNYRCRTPASIHAVRNSERQFAPTLGRIIHDGVEATKFVDAHDMKTVDALVTFENEYWAYEEAFACISFRLYSNRTIFSTSELRIFRRITFKIRMASSSKTDKIYEHWRIN
jgi:hypothetical protein